MARLVEALPAASELEGVLAHRPELQERYRAFMQSVRRDGNVPPRILELCRVRIAHIHDCAAELSVTDDAAPLSAADKANLAAGAFHEFSAAEQAALVVAEKMPFNHHGLSDEEVAAADAQLGHAGSVALLTALAFFDVQCRLKLMLGFDASVESVSADYLV